METNNPTDFNNPNPMNNPMNPGFFGQKKLPNAVAVLVLGICSIFPGCFCAGIVGLVCGIIALVLAKKDLALYNANPNDYLLANYTNLKAGRICAIIGIILSSLYLLYIIVVVLIMGTAFSMMPWGMMK
jgi:hypothetical protein